ncbi:hypothetical protein K438DRAFT_1001700 [Mycena galopus ATCC 62051]|nr:hypothetical protein K438DRAFT_1001700 [Mycena galopus ATCC 62051]
MNELSEQLRCLTTMRRHLLRRMTVDVRGVEHHTRLQQRIAELDRRIEDTRRSMVNVYLAGLYPVHYYISYDLACRRREIIRTEISVLQYSLLSPPSVPEIVKEYQNWGRSDNAFADGEKRMEINILNRNKIPVHASFQFQTNLRSRTLGR